MSSSSRVLGFWACTALVVGNTIGIGIFLLPASLAPFGLNALTAWGITLLGCVFLAVVLSGLARAFPEGDGPYAYTQHAFGSGITFFVLWCYWFATWVTNATIAIGIVGYLSILIPSLEKVKWLPPYIALALVWLFVLINCLGVRAAAWMQMVTTALKLLPQLGIILLGLWELIAHPSIYTEHIPPNPVSYHDVLVASTLTLFAMLGIECAMIPAGKVQDPARTIPRATLVGMLVTGLIYICISTVSLLLLPQSELAASSSPLADVFGKYAGAEYGRWLAFFVVVGGLGALNGWTLIVGEMTETFARHGNFPAALGNPKLSFVFTGVLASAMLVLNYESSLTTVFTFLINVITAANLPFYLACALAVLALWKTGRFRQWERVAAVLSLVFCLWVFQGVGGRAFLWTAGLAILGVPFAALRHSRTPNP
jgi:basic amino acid/polyamine antiporter, APA family